MFTADSPWCQTVFTTYSRLPKHQRRALVMDAFRDFDIPESVYEELEARWN